MWKVGLASIVAAGLLLSAFERAEAQCDYGPNQCEGHTGCLWQSPDGPCYAWTPSYTFLLEVQKKLKVHPDGKFGAETEAAIRKFQEEKGLKVKQPGKLDFETYKALRSEKTK